jgi:hypothetical protein
LNLEKRLVLVVMKLRSVAPQWFSDDPNKQAKCVSFPATREYDPWYGDSDSEDEPDYSETEDAKNICTGIYDGKPCPLLESCLEFAMTNNERYGIWGGLDPDQRAKLRKERKIAKSNE